MVSIAASRSHWLLLALAAGCAEAATSDDPELEGYDSAIVADEVSDAGDDFDADLSWPDTGIDYDAGGQLDSAAAGSDAGSDPGARDGGSSDSGTWDGGADASADAGPRDAGVDSSVVDASTTDAGVDSSVVGVDSSVFDASTADASTADASTTDAGGSNMCKESECKNECSIDAPFRCCKSDGKCGCSWVSGVYCN